MCKKVDNNVEICNFIKAVRFLAIISVIWVMLGMILVVFCLVVGAEQLFSDKEDLDVEVGVVGYIFGWSFAICPFLIAGFLELLIYSRLFWLYIIAIISEIAVILIFSGILSISFLENFEIPILRHRFEVICGSIGVILVEILTIYAMFVLICSKNRRKSDIEEEISESDE